MSQPVKRSVTIDGHRTSVSLEPEFWDLLHSQAEELGIPVARLIRQIDRTRSGNLSSAIRVWLVHQLLARGRSP